MIERDGEKEKTPDGGLKRMREVKKKASELGDM